MDTGTSVGDQTVVVELYVGDDTDTTPELRFHLHDVVLAGARSIVVDASSMDAIPSAAIAAMLTAHRACRRRGGRLTIRHPSRRALDQLARTGLWRVLEVEPR
jgi:anti-anti-sigma factor